MSLYQRAVTFMNTMDFYLRFPSVLKKALSEGEVSFKTIPIIDYKPFIAYRRISRVNGDTTPINKSDFFSYMEMSDKQRPRTANKKEIGSYSCSLNRSIENLKNALGLPKPNKQIIKGWVQCEYGPQYTNSASLHVDWWLYEDANFFHEFEVVKNE